MSQNPLANYFTNNSDFLVNNTGGINNNSQPDLAGRTFFDIIAECKDFSKRNSFFKISIKINLFFENI